MFASNLTVMSIAEITALLRPIETEACALYRELADHFTIPPTLPLFLRALAEDERKHLEMLNDAEKLLRETPDMPKASLRFSAADSQQMIQTLRGLRERADGGRLSEMELLEGIIEAEFSEWNEVFLYIMAHFRHLAPNFQHYVSVVQQHRRHIEEYLTSRPAEVHPPNAAHALPRVWEEQILVADDNDALRLVTGEFLSRLGKVTTAVDGADALARTQETFFDVIVSDVDMPGLDGLQLFDAVTAATPSEQCRFIFITGIARPRLEELYAQGRAQLLLKPFSLTELQEVVASVLKKES